MCRARESMVGRKWKALCASKWMRSITVCKCVASYRTCSLRNLLLLRPFLSSFTVCLRILLDGTIHSWTNLADNIFFMFAFRAEPLSSAFPLICPPKPWKFSTFSFLLGSKYLKKSNKRFNTRNIINCASLIARKRYPTGSWKFLFIS